MPSIEKALVVGGGIGGLTAGVALRQQGIVTDLIEINPNLNVYGVGIIQPNNTLRALDKIGLAQPCVDLGCAFPGWRIFDSHGKILMDAPNKSTAAPNMPPNNGITRPFFHKVLTEAAYDQGVSIRLGTHLTSIENNPDKARVTFSDGTSAEYDLVIGCDGIYSDMRDRIFPDAPKLEFTGQAVWRYNFPRPQGMEWGEVHFGPSSKVGLVPMLEDYIYMFLVSAEPGNPRMPKDRLASLMRERLKGFTDRIAEMGERITDNSAVVYKPMENLVLPDPWYRNRAIIIGDGAHATTPHLAQGAAMAIEDAVLLAELVGQDGDLQSQLREFMDRRFKRAQYVVASSDQIARWEMEEWKGIENPEADPGGLLQRATLAMLEEY